MQALETKILHGAKSQIYAELIAQLRIELFAEFPYLYKGTMDHDLSYLSVYFNSPNSSIILFFDKEELVGYSSSIPLSEEWDVIKEPFITNGLDLSKYLYVGEVMVKEGYRSWHLVHKILEIHNKKAAYYGFPYLAALTIDRPDDHPCKPVNYRTHDKLWQRFGWQKSSSLKARFDWEQIDTNRKELNDLSVWIKTLNIHSKNS